MNQLDEHSQNVISHCLPLNYIPVHEQILHLVIF